jgi:hypothetical protein
MKKYIFIVSLIFGISNLLYSQCINGVSTSHTAPTNNSLPNNTTVSPSGNKFLNTFDWFPVSNGFYSNYNPINLIYASINIGTLSNIMNSQQSPYYYNYIYDGPLFQMSEYDFYIKNQEVGDLFLRSANAGLKIRGATGRLDVGANAGTSVSNASFNIASGNDNGLLIRTTLTGKYGMTVDTKSTNDAILVRDYNTLEKNFKVGGNGFVFARKYTTTIANMPDYVFAEDYALMTFAELRTFVQKEKHLPNVPSAKEYESKGVDLGEMNRVLLEKVEELTLYILQLEERMKVVENSK